MCALVCQKSWTTSRFPNIHVPLETNDLNCSRSEFNIRENENTTSVDDNTSRNYVSSCGDKSKVLKSESSRRSHVASHGSSASLSGVKGAENGSKKSSHRRTSEDGASADTRKEQTGDMSGIQQNTRFPQESDEFSSNAAGAHSLRDIKPYASLPNPTLGTQIPGAKIRETQEEELEKIRQKIDAMGADNKDNEKSQINDKKEVVDDENEKNADAQKVYKAGVIDAQQGHTFEVSNPVSSPQGSRLDVKSILSNQSDLSMDTVPKDLLDHSTNPESVHRERLFTQPATDPTNLDRSKPLSAALAEGTSSLPSLGAKCHDV